MTDPDMRALRHDDRVLDRIGRGERLADGDVEAMLSAWRQTLPVAGPPDPRLVAAVTTRPAKPKRKVVRTSVSVAASVALLAGGVMVGAAYVNPDSPLWPVTKFVYGNVEDPHTALDDANDAVAQARTAVRRGQYADAAALLSSADELADKVDDPGAAKRLRHDIAGLRAKLPDAPQTSAGSTNVHPTAGRPGKPAPQGPASDDPPPGHQPEPDFPGNGPGVGQDEGNGDGPADHGDNGDGAHRTPPGQQKPHKGGPHHPAPPGK
jgi:hypothetical protein